MNVFILDISKVQAVSGKLTELSIDLVTRTNIPKARMTVMNTRSDVATLFDADEKDVQAVHSKRKSLKRGEINTIKYKFGFHLDDSAGTHALLPLEILIEDGQGRVVSDDRESRIIADVKAGS